MSREWHALRGCAGPFWGHGRAGETSREVRMTFAGERSTASRRAAGIVVLSVALTLGLASCSADPPGPDEASKALAASLSSGKFSSAPLTAADAGAAAAQWAAAYEGLKPWKPTVKLASTAVDENEDRKSVV